MLQNKNEVLQKKLETNIKSASGIFAMAGVLGIIYLVRYFIKGFFDFYFGLSFTEIMLKLAQDNLLPKVLSYALIALFLIFFAVCAVNAVKNEKWLLVCIGVYSFDFLCLVLDMFVLSFAPVTADRFVDVIFHFLVTLFLVVGLVSVKKMKKMKL